MLPTHTFTTADAWLQWFDTSQQTACRAFLCTRYHLDALDAEALMNTARFQVFLHWRAIDNPLAYFWHTHHAARTAQQVADLLERVTSRQRHLLARLSGTTDWSYRGGLGPLERRRLEECQLRKSTKGEEWSP